MRLIRSFTPYTTTKFKHPTDGVYRSTNSNSNRTLIHTVILLPNFTANFGSLFKKNSLKTVAHYFVSLEPACFSWMMIVVSNVSLPISCLIYFLVYSFCLSPLTTFHVSRVPVPRRLFLYSSRFALILHFLLDYLSLSLPLYFSQISHRCH